MICAVLFLLVQWIGYKILTLEARVRFPDGKFSFLIQNTSVNLPITTVNRRIVKQTIYLHSGKRIMNLSVLKGNYYNRKLFQGIVKYLFESNLAIFIAFTTPLRVTNNNKE